MGCKEGSSTSSPQGGQFFGNTPDLGNGRDCGRTEAVLILFDHGLEMLLKAAIRRRQGKTHKPGKNQSIGFGSCVRNALTEADVKFLSDEQAPVK